MEVRLFELLNCGVKIEMPILCRPRQQAERPDFLETSSHCDNGSFAVIAQDQISSDDHGQGDGRSFSGIERGNGRVRALRN